VGEDAAEGLGADVALADVGVAIDVRGQGELTVVGVNYMHIGETEQRFGAAQGVAKTGLGSDIETRGQVTVLLENTAGAGKSPRQPIRGTQVHARKDADVAT
jgi:hypothetical protein